MNRVTRNRFLYQRIPKWKHFDWSGMTDWATENQIDDYEVVTLLRDPIQRAISHFNFIKSQSWVSDAQKPIIEFVNHIANLTKLGLHTSNGTRKPFLGFRRI